MKPHPDSIERALKMLDQPAGRCAFIGDSVTDIEVSHLTGVRSIGFAKNPRRGDELAASGADTVVRELVDLANEIRVQARTRT